MGPNLTLTNLIKLVFLFVSYAHILYCPFSKVEESFSTQAIHDILFYGSNLTQYDHNEFPGVVPRTFIGPQLVASISKPFVNYIVNKTDNIFLGQLIARCVLGCLVTFGFFNFTGAVRKQFGANVEKWTILITLSQFHFMFYMGRTLPNTFALIFFLHLTALWLNQQHKPFVWLSAFVILVFRFELAIICGIMLLISLVKRKLSITSVLAIGIVASVLFIGLSVLIDSYYWGYWLWPEGQVLWFNTVLNKSSDWGTSPFAWYFYSALPRALLLSLFLVPLGLLYQTHKALVYFIVPSIGFIFIYSFLPHKELRFIIYVFPLLNAIAAKGIDDFKKYRMITNFYMKSFILFAIYTHFIINVMITCGFLYISKMNYPGAYALIKLHEIEPKETYVNVHIDVFSAQTGVTRFLELNRNHGWTYDKYEYTNKSQYSNKHTHLLVEGESESDLEVFKSMYKIVAFVRARWHLFGLFASVAYATYYEDSESFHFKKANTIIFLFFFVKHL